MHQENDSTRGADYEKSMSGETTYTSRLRLCNSDRDSYLASKRQYSQKRSRNAVDAMDGNERIALTQPQEDEMLLPVDRSITQRINEGNFIVAGQTVSGKGQEIGQN